VEDGGILQELEKRILQRGVEKDGICQQLEKPQLRNFGKGIQGKMGEKPAQGLGGGGHIKREDRGQRLRKKG